MSFLGAGFVQGKVWSSDEPTRRTIWGTLHGTDGEEEELEEDDRKCGHTPCPVVSFQGMRLERMQRREEGRGSSSRTLRTLELQSHRLCSSRTVRICLFRHTSCTSSSPPASFHPICSWKKICWGLTLTSGVLADAPPLWFLKLWALRQTQYWQWNQGEMLSVVGDSHQPLLLKSRQAQSYPPGKGTRISSWW